MIRQFIKGKNPVYYMATESSGEKNMEMLSKLILKHSGTEFRFSGFSDFEVLFDYLAEISKSERMVFVIDEFPYLAAGYPEISSSFRNTAIMNGVIPDCISFYADLP